MPILARAAPTHWLNSSKRKEPKGAFEHSAIQDLIVRYFFATGRRSECLADTFGPENCPFNPIPLPTIALATTAVNNHSLCLNISLTLVPDPLCSGWMEDWGVWRQRIYRWYLQESISTLCWTHGRDDATSWDIWTKRLDWPSEVYSTCWPVRFHLICYLPKLYWCCFRAARAPNSRAFDNIRFY